MHPKSASRHQEGVASVAFVARWTPTRPTRGVVESVIGERKPASTRDRGGLVGWFHAVSESAAGSIGKSSLSPALMKSLSRNLKMNEYAIGESNRRLPSNARRLIQVVSFWAIALVPLLGTACVSSYEYDRPTLQGESLETDRGVLVCTPENGWYSTTEYPGSGASTARALREAFVAHARVVKIGQTCEEEVCLDGIDTDRFGYVVCPTILHWENRATEWSGLPDRIRIGIVIYDSRNRNVVAKGSYAGKSKWATLGGDKPEDLLPQPTKEFVDYLYAEVDKTNGD